MSQEQTSRTNLTWRKARMSNNSGACVEVARTPGDSYIWGQRLDLGAQGQRPPFIADVTSGIFIRMIM